MKTRIPRIPAGGEQGNRENCNTVSAASSSRDRESNMCSRVAVGTDLLALTPFPPTIRPKYDVPKAANQLPTSEKAICKVSTSDFLSRLAALFLGLWSGRVPQSQKSF